VFECGTYAGLELRAGEIVLDRDDHDVVVKAQRLG
jgi:hypothetical protein